MREAAAGALDRRAAALAYPGKHLFERLRDPRIELLEGAPERGVDADLLVFPCHNFKDFMLVRSGRSPQLPAGALERARGLVFDASCEGSEHEPGRSAALHEFLEQTGIDARRAVYVAQNRLYRADYEAWLASAGRGPPMSVLTYDYWIQRFFMQLEPHGEAWFSKRRKWFRNRPARRSRRFVSLNLTARPSRVLFLLRLLKDGLWDQGHVSFGGFQQRAPDKRVELEKFRKRICADPDFGDLALELSPLLASLDAIGRVLFRYGKEHLPERGLKVPMTSDTALPEYNDAWFTVVTESEMTARPLRVTEKPFSALVNFQPLIVFGNPGALALIRSLGFETFAGAIDESYDEEPDPRRRFEMAYREFVRLCRMDEDELFRLERSLAHVLVHNARWGLTRLPFIYRDQIEPALVDQILAAVDPGRLQGAAGASA